MTSFIVISCICLAYIPSHILTLNNERNSPQDVQTDVLIKVNYTKDKEVCQKVIEFENDNLGNRMEQYQQSKEYSAQNPEYSIRSTANRGMPTSAFSGSNFGGQAVYFHGSLVHVQYVTSPNNQGYNACEDIKVPKWSGNYIVLTQDASCKFEHQLDNIFKDTQAIAAIIYGSGKATSQKPKIINYGGSKEHRSRVALFLPWDKMETVMKFCFGYSEDKFIMNTVNVTDICNITVTIQETDRGNYLNRTSVLFVSISFILLMIISFAWLVFYYVQRFRYIHTKEQHSRRLAHLAKKAVAKIPVRMLKQGDKETDPEIDQCAICIEVYKPSDNIRDLPCKHHFHKSCIDPWLLDQRSCPICKMDILRAYGLMPNEGISIVSERGSDHGSQEGLSASSDLHGIGSVIIVEQGRHGGHSVAVVPVPDGSHTRTTRTSADDLQHRRRGITDLYQRLHSYMRRHMRHFRLTRRPRGSTIDSEELPPRHRHHPAESGSSGDPSADRTRVSVRLLQVAPNERTVTEDASTSTTALLSAFALEAPGNCSGKQAVSAPVGLHQVDTVPAVSTVSSPSSTSSGSASDSQEDDGAGEKTMCLRVQVERPPTANGDASDTS